MKIYSKGCEYALRVLVEIPAQDVNKNFLAKDICRRAKVPLTSARKVLQGLVDQGLLEAVPGPGGGYRFKKDPQKISLLDIVYAVDGQESFNQCVMGLPVCSSTHPCPAHQLWQQLKTKIVDKFTHQNLKQLMLMTSK